MNVRLKRTPGIYLVGFMGCGKSTVGRLLAADLGWSFVDIDEDIEREQNQSISAIFDTHGEEQFRRIEAEAIRKRVAAICCGRPMVIALGGGAFTQEANIDLVSKHGITIWLDLPLDLVRERIACSTRRPLARDPRKLEELYYARRPFYERADYRIEITENDSAQAAREIRKLPIF